MTQKPAPMTGGLDLPRVTTVQATMKAGRHAWRVAWLPFEGWWCTPEPLTRACPDQRRCEHITAVQATVTPPEDQ